MTDELVALYDDVGNSCGTAPRSQVRAQNLQHAASAIVVTNSAGQIYLHRRTTTKDVFPGLYDFAAGGVLGAGEEPADGARRELGEELGITGVEPVFLKQARYQDEHTTYWAFCYRVTWDGPIRHQPEEVQWGAWVSPDELRRRIQADRASFVPDSLALWPDLIRTGAAGATTVPRRAR